MRHPLQRRATWLMVLLLLLPAVALTARERTSTISGIVVDQRGHGLARAQVFLMDRQGTSLLETTHTDSTGHYSFSGLFPQAYQLRAEKPGYGPERIGPLATRPGMMVTAPFVMQAGPAPDAPPPVVDASTDAPPPPTVKPAREAARPVAHREPEGTLAETLAGTNRDALKALDRPGTAVGAGGPVGTRRLDGVLLVAGGGSPAAGGQSILMASLSGQALGPSHWTVDLGREDNPVLYSSGPGGPLIWRMVRTRTAALEISPAMFRSDGHCRPEQTFRLQLTERLPSEGRPGAMGLRSLSAGWDRLSTDGHHRMGMDVHHASATGSAAGPGNGPSLFLLDGRLRSRLSPTHELLLQWRLGTLEEGLSLPAIHSPGTGGFSGAPGGAISPAAAGWGSVIRGSERWTALEPLQLLCNMEYRVTGGATGTRVARPSMGLVYSPFDRMSVSSSVGLALRDQGTVQLPAKTLSEAAGHPSRRWQSELEYGFSLEQGFGRGYNLELDLSVEDLQPASPADLDPASMAGQPAGGGFIALSGDGTARTRQMRLALSKEFGTMLAGSLGTSVIDGQGDIQALPALPGDKEPWADGPDGGNRIRGFSGHLDTFLPAAGTGILVTFHRLTNLESGLLDRDRAPTGEITGLDVGLRQRILRTAGLDLQLLMAISSMALDADSFHGLVESLVSDASPYRRIVGGLRVHF